MIHSGALMAGVWQPATMERLCRNPRSRAVCLHGVCSRREQAVQVALSGCQSAALHHDGELAWEVGDDNGSSQAVEISLRAT